MKCRDSAILRLPEVMEAIDSALPEGFYLGKYKLLSVLGRGSSGIAYIGWDKELERNVVLKECFPSIICVRDQETKCIKPSVPDLEPYYRDAMAALKKEAQTLASLNHEHIVRVYEIFELYGSLFYVMPWLDGGSLNERMDDASSGRTAIPPKQAREWLLALLDCLEYLHGKGIYHRDIKPGNILFDDQNRPVLIDFGAALNKPEISGTVTQGEYTPSYASPEQITGKGEIGPWTDLYALAVTWYRLISGIPAEQADKRLMQDGVVPLSSMTLSESWPRELLASIDRNLRLKPEERCQTAGQWKEWLEQGKPRGLRKTGVYRKSVPFAVTVAVIIFVLAGVWIGEQPFRTDIPPPSSNTDGQWATKPSQEFKDALYKKIRAYYKLDDYLGKAKEYERKIETAQSQCLKEMDELKQELEKEIQSTLTNNDALDYPLNIIGKRYDPLLKKWRTTYDELNKGYLNEVILPLANITDNVIATYPAETRDEEILLPSMEDRIGKECNDAMRADCLWEFNDVMGKKSVEQMGSLTKMTQRRAKELPVSQE